MVIVGILSLIAFFFTCRSVKVLHENQRGVLFRRGQFEKTLAPGFHMIYPYFDRLLRVNVFEKIPEWQSLSAYELDERLKEVVITELM